MTSSGGHFVDLRGLHEFIRDLSRQVESIVRLNTRRSAMAGKPLLQEQSLGSDRVTLIVTARHCLCKFEKRDNDDKVFRADTSGAPRSCRVNH